MTRKNYHFLLLRFFQCVVEVFSLFLTYTCLHYNPIRQFVREKQYENTLNVIDFEVLKFISVSMVVVVVVIFGESESVNREMNLSQCSVAMKAISFAKSNESNGEATRSNNNSSKWTAAIANAVAAPTKDFGRF